MAGEGIGPDPQGPEEKACGPGSRRQEGAAAPGRQERRAFSGTASMRTWEAWL